MESQIKILLVDANETFTAQLSSVLGQNPAFDVVGTANDGECAVELLHREQPDVLIMDLLLPKLDGISVLKEASSLPKPPLGLVLTGLLTDYAAQAAEKLGVRYFISKPCNLQMVAERVMEIVAAERADKKPFRQEAQVGNLDHPRNRRSGARQGLSVSARGNFNCRRRHGRDQRHHKSSLPAGRKDVFHDALSRRARHPARHRAGVGPRRSGNAAKILRLHRLQHQRQAHQLRVHRPHCR